MGHRRQIPLDKHPIFEQLPKQLKTGWLVKRRKAVVVNTRPGFASCGDVLAAEVVNQLLHNLHAGERLPTK